MTKVFYTSIAMVSITLKKINWLLPAAPALLCLHQLIVVNKRANEHYSVSFGFIAIIFFNTNSLCSF